MAEQRVAMQGTETPWDALRRMVMQDVADYEEAAASYGRYARGVDPDGSGRDGVIRCRGKREAVQHVLRYMDDLEHQEREASQ